jgi:hypothetical protein
LVEGKIRVGRVEGVCGSALSPAMTARLTAESEALGGEVDRFLNRIKAA